MPEKSFWDHYSEVDFLKKILPHKLRLEAVKLFWSQNLIVVAEKR